MSDDADLILSPAAGTAQPYVLFDLVRPAGSRPIPAVFEEAAALDRRARAAYAAGDYRRSAAVFMDVAATLRGEPDGFYAGTLRTDRALAYENAALAWLMADAADEARQALGQAAAADPACADTIQQLLTGFLG